MTTRQKVALKAFGAFVATVLATACIRTSAQTVKAPVDPGVRAGAAGAGSPLNNLTADEKTFFQDGFTRFIEVEVVQGGSNNGLGPRFNSNQCLSCHAQPAPGGTSPAQNPLIAVATLNGAKNVLPWFISAKGPVSNANRSANDGTFGWKAQNKSLIMFASEAYNVEMGISNQLFPQERDETPACLFTATPNDTLNFTTAPTGAATSNPAVISDIEAFANFMRMLAPPTPAPDTPSTVNGRATFTKVGCAHCHTPSFTTGKMIASGSSTNPSAALSNQTVNLFSDLLVHHMGRGLADGITQGGAGPDEFRTAPLWGVGQRVFFLHDGRTRNLVEVIEDHQSPGSEANRVIERFRRLPTQEQQDVINFLRSL